MKAPQVATFVGRKITVRQRVDHCEAYLRIETVDGARDLFTLGLMTVEQLEGATREIDGGLVYELSLGPVDNDPSAHAYLDLTPHAIDLASLKPFGDGLPPIGASDGTVQRHYPALTIPCVNAECGEPMNLVVQTRKGWLVQWKTEMYFECRECHARTDKRSKSNTAAMIAEGLFALRLWATRGQRMR